MSALDAVRRDNPGWSVWQSDEGRIWATSTWPLPGRPGISATAPTADGIGKAIAAVLAEVAADARHEAWLAGARSAA